MSIPLPKKSKKFYTLIITLSRLVHSVDEDGFKKNN